MKGRIEESRQAHQDGPDAPGKTDLMARAGAREQPAQHGHPFDVGRVDVQSACDSVAPVGRPTMQPVTEVVPPSVIAGGGVTITCPDYRAHQLRHRRVGGRFQCDLCEAVSW